MSNNFQNGENTSESNNQVKLLLLLCLVKGLTLREGLKNKKESGISTFGSCLPPETKQFFKHF